MRFVGYPAMLTDNVICSNTTSFQKPLSNLLKMTVSGFTVNRLATLLPSNQIKLSFKLERLWLDTFSKRFVNKMV
jgi:hypothetical protein